MKADPLIIERILTSYKLMLDFYGMQLVSPESGLVDRSLPPRNFSARYINLIRKLVIFHSGSAHHSYIQINQVHLIIIYGYLAS